MITLNCSVCIPAWCLAPLQISNHKHNTSKLVLNPEPSFNCLKACEDGIYTELFSFIVVFVRLTNNADIRNILLHCTVEADHKNQL